MRPRVLLHGLVLGLLGWVLLAVVGIGVSQALAATCSLYTDATPGAGSAFTGNVGTRFTVTGEGASATAARFWLDADETGASHTVRLWTDSGSVLDSIVIGHAEEASGWQTGNFTAPIALSDGVTYVIAVEINDELVDASGTTGTADCGPLTREDTTSGSTFFGRYTTGTGASRPNTAFGTGHYFVDVTVDYETEEEPPPPDPDATDAQLTWWGIWALVGLSFVSMIAGPFMSAFRVTRGM